MSTDIVKRDEDAFELGKVFKQSGMFPTMKHEAEAVVKILAGREFGLGPMAAMNGINVVDGKPTLSANLIAGQIKRHPSYDYAVLRRDETGCELQFFEFTSPGDSRTRTILGKISFEKKDAERAGLLGKQNWKKYPRDMYFARCLTAGARTYCPDVLGGSPIYTAEELGADMAETPQEAVSGVSADDLKYGVNPAELGVPDAEVVPDEPGPERVGTSTLTYLREQFVASGKSDDDLAWMLLSVGVTSLPANPSRADIGAAMKSLTKVQAVRLGEMFEGEDDGVPGSGETT